MSFKENDYSDWEDKKAPPIEHDLKGTRSHVIHGHSGGIISIHRLWLFIAIWFFIAFIGQYSSYFDALGFFLAFMITFADKIYRFLRRIPR